MKRSVVPASHALIRRIAGGRARPLPWATVRAALHAVAARQNRESETVLRLLLNRDYHIPLSAGSDGPHAMSPEDMVRCHAMQVLARWDLRRHRTAIRRAAAGSRSPVLVELARALQA
jgi:hypothetical protein